MMKHMRKLLAAMLVLVLVLSLGGTALAATVKFTKGDTSAEKLVFAKFQSDLRGYTGHNTSRRSNVVILKGSLAQVVGVYGTSWVKLRLVTSCNVDHPDLNMWFRTYHLKRVEDPDFVLEPYHAPRYHSKVTFKDGGSGHTWQKDVNTDPKLVGRRVKVTGKVNLRKSASLAGKSCGVVRKGEKVTLNGKVGIDCRDVVFFGVTIHRRDYFISSRFLDIKGYKYRFSDDFDGWF